MKIVINGANGYVTSHFINKLLCQKYKVVALVRDSKKLSSANRMKNALIKISNNKNTNYKNLKVYSYSLNDEFNLIPIKFNTNNEIK